MCNFHNRIKVHESTGGRVLLEKGLYLIFPLYVTRLIIKWISCHIISSNNMFKILLLHLCQSIQKDHRYRKNTEKKDI